MTDQQEKNWNLTCPAQQQELNTKGVSRGLKVGASNTAPGSAGVARFCWVLPRQAAVEVDVRWALPHLRRHTWIKTRGRGASNESRSSVPVRSDLHGATKGLTWQRAERR